MEKYADWRKRWRYWIDNQFSKGTVSLIKWLGVLSAALILAMGLIISLLRIAPEGEEPLTFSEAAWRSLMRTLDPGTMGGDTGWGYRLISFLVTLGGIFIISTLIGLLSSAIELKLQELQKGRSEVVEFGHTVILGWSEQVFPIISELVEANSNQRKPCIVVLAEMDKIRMEDEIAQRVENLRNTRLVCRSGNPMDILDLNIVSFNTAKSIIVLSSEQEDPDSQTLKTVLAILNHPQRRSEPFHIVAQVHNQENMEVAGIIGNEEVEWIQVGSFISSVIAQTCRQSGLSVVYTDLLDFSGDEIYTKFIPQAVGKTYREILPLFEKNAVMGVIREGKIAQLNPPMDSLVGSSDEIILIAEDDDKIALDGLQSGAFQEEHLYTKAVAPIYPEHSMILGWNPKGPMVIEAMDAYVKPGSDLLVVSRDERLKSAHEWMDENLRNLKLSFLQGDPANRRLLNHLDLEKIHNIILLCCDQLEPQRADAQTLMTLLHLRDIVEKRKLTFSIVSEMMDIRNRDLADVTRADDFIVSNRLISLLVVQFAENKKLASVFKDIFDPAGSEIYLKPVENYIQIAQPVNFYTILGAAQVQGETAIGYRIRADAKNAHKNYGIHLNPAKSEMVSFQPSDKIIVVADA
jgi:voltage-gated potassium channel Kch